MTMLREARLDAPGILGYLIVGWLEKRMVTDDSTDGDNFVAGLEVVAPRPRQLSMVGH